MLCHVLIHKISFVFVISFPRAGFITSHDRYHHVIISVFPHDSYQNLPTFTLSP